MNTEKTNFIAANESIMTLLSLGLFDQSLSSLVRGNRAEIKDLEDHLVFDHVARLISFPEVQQAPLSTPQGVVIPETIPCRSEVIYVVKSLLGKLAIADTIKIFPSTIVARRLLRHPRLAARYSEGVPTAIVLAQFRSGHKAELFVVNALNQEETHAELIGQTESHIAFRLRALEALTTVREIFESNAFLSDGGGINPNQTLSDSNLAGTTTLYFRRIKPFQRIEIILPGMHEDVFHK